MLKKSILPVLTLIYLLTVVGCGKPAGSIVAEVDGTKIYSEDLTNEINIQSQKFDKAIRTDEAAYAKLRRSSLDKLIEEAILLNNAAKLGIKPDKKVLDSKLAMNKSEKKLIAEGLSERGISEKAWRRAQERRATIDELLKKEVFEKVPVSDDSVKAYYNKNIANYMRPSQFRASQILVDNREKAEEISAALKKGESFEKLAKEYSQSPDAKRGGDLGYFDARSFPEAFIRICSELSVGETSDVVATEYGFQIFHLVDKRPARQISFDEAKANIRQQLAEDKAEGFFKSWYEDLKSKSSIKVDEQALSKVLQGKDKA